MFSDRKIITDDCLLELLRKAHKLWNCRLYNTGLTEEGFSYDCIEFKTFIAMKLLFLIARSMLWDLLLKLYLTLYLHHPLSVVSLLRGGGARKATTKDLRYLHIQEQYKSRYKSCSVFTFPYILIPFSPSEEILLFTLSRKANDMEEDYVNT